MRYEGQTCTKLNLLSQGIFKNSTCSAFLWFLFWLEIATVVEILSKTHRLWRAKHSFGAGGMSLTVSYMYLLRVREIARNRA